MDQLQTYLQQIQGDQITWLGLSAVVLLWLLWSLAKKLVQIGFFVIAFVIGSGIAYGVAFATGQPIRPEAILAAGLAFAFVWNMIRAKIARTITSLAVAGMLSLGAHQGWTMFGAKPNPAEAPARAAPAKKKPVASTPKPATKKPTQKKPARPAGSAPK